MDLIYLIMVLAFFLIAMVYTAGLELLLGEIDE